LRELGPEDIDKLVQVKGIVIRTSSIIPEMYNAVFKCATCMREIEVLLQNSTKIEEPTKCDQCQSRYSFELIHNFCAFHDKQNVKLQETPESIPEGETPMTV
jgi:DNA replication licensing factor MCM4